MKSLYRLLVSLGIQPKLILASLKGWPDFRRDLREIKRQLKSNDDFKISILYPILRERQESNGDLTSHYFHEDLWAARKIFQNHPSKHVDVGSRVDGLVAHVASFREIEVFDIRPQESHVKNIRFVTADFMKIQPELHDYTDSLSSMNVIEHFGLGRYGDPIDVNGHLKGLDAMLKVLKPGGKFYFSTPIGPQRIEFNAHRVFALKYLVGILARNYVIDSFSYVDDRGHLHEDVPLSVDRIADNCGCKLGFGIFEMTKK
jgi:hypothetical protein